jgi:hypothetical protein
MKGLLNVIKAKELKPLYSAAFVTCCILFLVHQLTQRVLHISIPLADSYLDNFLATPILLTLLLVERRTLFRYGLNYTLSVTEVGLATLFIAVVGEVLFPKLSREFTADWLDVVFYSLGSVLFYVKVNKKGH